MPEAGRSILCVKVLVRFPGHVPTVTYSNAFPTPPYSNGCYNILVI
ncbi:hypothetical protein T09_10785 [Trichinella sp. T9]|nr:hypothetical protein T09_10785 [Trichinella sp. T9]